MWKAEIFKELILLKEQSLRNFSFSNSEYCSQIILDDINGIDMILLD